MQAQHLWQACALFFVATFLVSGCVNHNTEQQPPQDNEYPYSKHYDESKFVARLPQSLDTKHEKLILVDPKIYAWGAYNANGELVRGGIATAGADYCPDDQEPCRTKTGSFRIYAMRGEECASHIYPRGKGGALMPYCMFFNGGESLHGSPDHMLVEQNISHGCVHLRIPDAEWLHDDFARIGTRVIVLPYE
jgi:hypothetical protein